MGILTKIGGGFVKLKGIVMASTATKVATVAVAVTVIGGGTATLAATGVFSSAEREIEKAYQVMQEAAEPTAFEEIFGLHALNAAIEEKGSEFGMNMTLQELDMGSLGLMGMKLPNIGVKLTGRMNKESEMNLDLGLSMAGTTLLTGNLYLDEKQLQAAVPGLFSPVLMMNYSSESWPEEVQNSYLVDALGLDKEELRIILEKLSEDVSDRDFVKEYGELAIELAKAVYGLSEGTDYDKAGKQELEVRGETMNCKVYTAEVEEEALDEFLDQIMPMIQGIAKELYDGLQQAETPYAMSYEELEQKYLDFYRDIHEVRMMFYVHEDRIVKQELSFIVQDQPAMAEMTYDRIGNPYENMELALKLPMPEREAFDFSYNIHTENTEDALVVRVNETLEGTPVEILFQYEKLDGEFEFFSEMGGDSIELVGAVSELEKGRKIGLELDMITVTDDEYKENTVLNANLYVQVLETPVAALVGEQKDVLQMTEADFAALGKEITANLYQLLWSLLGFGSF